MCSKGTAGGGYASVFYLADASGNSRGLLNGSQTATDGYNWDAFGNLVSRFGSNPTMFAWNEASGYQSDNDDGLTLLGCRYYDKRTGRFISQDPAGAGGNWYAYTDNDPMNGTDPSGLFKSTDMSFGDIYNEASLEGGPGSEWNTTDSHGNIIDHFFVSNPDMGIGTPGSGMIAGFEPGDGHSYHHTGSLNEHGEHVHQDNKNGRRFNKDGKHVDAHDKPIKNSKANVAKRFMDKYREGFDREMQAFRQRIQDGINNFKSDEQQGENNYKTNEERLNEMGYNSDGSTIEPEGEIPFEFIP